MATITQPLPPITNRVKFALFSAMRDFYQAVGQYLPVNPIQPKSQYANSRRTPKDLTVIERFLVTPHNLLVAISHANTVRSIKRKALKPQIPFCVHAG